MIKIIFIAGDGRSGSTLLESAISNANETIAVGECHRFWTRYVENKSLCGCSKPLRECRLWSSVHSELVKKFPNYDPDEFMLEMREFQRYKNFRQMPQLLNTNRWARFSKIIAAFYKAIAVYSEKTTIIDSSKSIPWARLLQTFPQFDVRVIHLERDLTGVANSWKKELHLPEYPDSDVYMPKKGNALILKTWLKVKLMSRVLPSGGKYLFIRYKELCNKPDETLSKVMEFADIRFDKEKLFVQPDHAIGGNPIRHQSKGKISINATIGQNKELSILERIGFSLVDKLARFVGP